ncbi:MAG: Hypoxanthine phosphoribosyltransferase [Chlamydiae bacterium]|nr:Hypoxanthine phosphoribosyltransferase [Chlamydiota bacterium]
MGAPSFPLIMNKTLLISESAIAQKVTEMAARLNREYANTPLTIVAILKGAFCLLADLIRKLDMPVEIEFIQASSYGMRGTTPGPLELHGTESFNVAGKHVVLLDDIYDTGATISKACHALQKQQPKTLKTCVLLKKKRAPEGDVTPDYVCFDIEDHFVVGYGLDYKEQGRGLKAIYAVT